MRLKARNRIVTAALALLVILVLLGAVLSGAPRVRAEEAFRLEVRTPPVGLATDHARERYWTLDRANGRLTLTALAADGAVQGQMTSRDTLTEARGLAYDGGEAYVGDVGGRRETVTIYQVTEPWPATDILRAIPYELTYPDGPETGVAIVVDADRRLHVITGGETPGIYRAPAQVPTPGPTALERIADAPADVTAAVALADGRWVVRNATTVLTLDPATFAVVGEAEIGVEERGHVLTQALDAASVLTGLGPEGLMTETAIPGPVPSTATPRPTRVPAPQTQATADPQDTRTYEQTGTSLALGGAALVAALAGLVVLVRR